MTRTLVYSHTEYQVTHKRLITLGIRRTQNRVETFTDEVRARNCVQALEALAETKLRLGNELIITDIKLRRRDVWLSPWEES